MMCALGSLASQQENPTQNTMNKVEKFLDYAISNPDAIDTYRASDMVLAAHSNASFSQKTRRAAEQDEIFFALKMNNTQLTMAQFSLFLKSLRQSCHQWLRQNWGLSILMHVRMYECEIS